MITKTLRTSFNGSSMPPQIVRFGVFEVDLESGRLRRNGRRVRLQQQPFQVLAMLLERPGQIVTREELQHRLWPADTFVDFDHGLNKDISKIRRALGDSAENSRFVETLARRGYRFIAEVTRDVPQEIGQVSLQPGASPEPAAESRPPAPLDHRTRRWDIRWTAVLAAVGVVAAVWLTLQLSRQDQNSSQSWRVVPLTGHRDETSIRRPTGGPLAPGKLRRLHPAAFGWRASPAHRQRSRRLLRTMVPGWALAGLPVE